MKDKIIFTAKFIACMFASMALGWSLAELSTHFWFQVICCLLVSSVIIFVFSISVSRRFF